ncbi:MAG: alpha/beta hydrolase-fold protein [Chloroflexota bacterium]
MNGTVIRYPHFKSNFVNPRHVEVWLPSGYSEGKYYPVLYMHDGQNLFFENDAYAGITWQIDPVLSNLIQTKKVPSTIVVGIWNDGDRRYADYLPQRPFTELSDREKANITPYLNGNPVQSDSYLKFLVSELKPFIDQTYPTLSERAHTKIMGSSMGGLISAYAVCEYPDVFSGAGCVSTNWISLPAVMARYMEEKLPKPQHHRFYFDYGTLGLDAFYEPHQMQVDKVMESIGYTQSEDWVTRKFEGADHNEAAWQERVHIPLEFLLKMN